MFWKKNNYKNKNLLELIPVKIVQSEDNGDKITLLIPRFKNKFFQNFIPKNKSPYIKINLDELGSEFWKNVDNNKDVYTIGLILKEKFGEKVEPVYERLNLFIYQLRRNGFLDLKERNND